MLLRALKPLAWLFLSPALMAAAPLQTEEYLGLPLWGWVLIVLGLLLLLSFALIVGLDWSNAPPPTDEEES